ncbi:hypothetical protein QCA50_008403 [Cerrena zonata]|uniref:Stress-response A/B barrel domain-containing protein n=1 Tax=Cerrena zonata TaxID=2478898 RepID=A0AAW0G3X1_9APHY
MTVKHIAFAKFKPTLDSDSKKETFERLKGLIETIHLVEGYTLGPPLKHPLARNQGWDIALLADFQDLETYNEYRQHETHLQMMKLLQGVTEDVLSYQIEVSPAPSKC